MRALPWLVFLAFVAACGTPLATSTPRPAESTPTRPAAAATPTTEVAYQPRFQVDGCWGSFPAAVSATCGYVAVPEDRGSPFDEENSVRLAVAVLQAPNVRYTQPPTFLLGGGPGQDVVGLFESLLKDYQYLLDNGFAPEQYVGHRQDMQEFKAVMDLFVADLKKRPFVIFDQRGTGYSQPSLKCHGEDWDVCRSRLISAGVDLAAYNTLENAADVNDIRLALGYEQVNLQGGSYGTRLALEVMRRYPRLARAVVLDGVAPPQMDWAVEMVSRYDDALSVLFDHCRADPACDQAYPELESVFYKTVERLNAEPIGVPVGERTETLNGDDLSDVVWNALYDLRTIRYLPMLIYSVSQGDPGVWGQFLDSKASEQAAETMAWGMHFSVECAERWAFETPQDLVRASTGLHPAIREAVVRSFADTFWVCEQWALPRAPSVVHTAVASDIPTLLLSGEFDPGTQPAFAELVAQSLSHHYLYVFPYLGHTDGFTSSCHASVLSAFLDHPDRRPDSACLEQMDHPVFVVP